ncbi:MAG: 2OG-Fe(II) oxygenase [Myxococcales bacterium]|nr:2OG-Fe(II) oxygenase [Myxococcales bacterium]
MSDPTIARVDRALARLRARGSFSSLHREPAQGLGVDVDGVGHIEVPIDEASAKALIAAAAPSPFGYRDQTRHDAGVRDSLEIAGERVHLDPRVWSRRFERGLQEVSEALGLPPDAEVSARLHKLLIYREGHFFAPHRDTERDPTMRATLVVLLPSEYEGGAVVVSHGDAQVTYDTAAERRDQIAFLGFYTDCIHEIRPVTRGHRVALTYGVHVEGDDEAPAADGPFPELAGALRAYFGPEPAEPASPWLVYLFEHHYSAQGLEWAGLKNGDRVRADALRVVSAELGYDTFLALADVHEAFEIDEEGGDPGFGIPPGGYGRRLGIELTLDHWIDGAGAPCQGCDEPADDGAVIGIGDPHQRAAYERSYEPWTGNEGGAAEQWYHQAAIVVVPRGSEFHEVIIGGESEPAPAPAQEAEPPPRARVIVRSRRR